MVVVSAPSASPHWSSGPPHGRSSPHPSTASQRARRFVAPTGSSKRDIGVSVVCMCWHVKRWFVLCDCALHSGHIGVGCVSCKILLRYPINSRHLFALSCTKVLLVYLGSVCSHACIFGGVSFITLFFVHVCKWLLTIAVCTSFILFFTVCKVACLR